MSGIIKTLGYFALLTFLLFSPFFLKGQIPFPGNYLLAWYEPWKSEHTVNGLITIAHKPVIDDAFRHLYPLRLLAVESLKNFHWPLWNPYNAAGTPLLAIMHSGYLNPFGLTYFLFSPPIAWSLFIIFQLVTLGLSHFVYCRTLRLSPLASLFSATILLLSGFVIVRLEYGEFIYVLAALPLLLALVERLRQNRRTKVRLVIPVLVLFLFLSGQPQMVIYVLGSFALYGVVRLWTHWKTLAQVATLTLLGFGLAAFQLLLSLELYSLSTITQRSSQFIFAKFLLPPTYFVTILIPNYFGNQATYNYFAVGKDYVETMASIGLISVFFAMLAITKKAWKSDQPIAFFILLTILTLASTLNWFGARLLFTLPIPVLSSDVPSRIFVLTTFGLAVLAGFGYERWLQSPKPTKEIMVKTIGYAGGIVAIVVVTLDLFLVKYPCPTANIPACRLISLRNSAIEVAAFGLFLSVFLGYFRAKAFQQVLVVVPIGLVAFVGLYNAYKFLPFSPKEAIFPPTPVLVELQKITGLDRFFGIGQANFRSNLTTQFRLYSPEYFEPLHVKRYAELINFANTGNPARELSRSDILITSDATPSASVNRSRDRLLDLLSVRYLIYSKEEILPAAPVVWQDAHWFVQKRESALARAYLVSDWRLADKGQELTQLFDPAFKPEEQVILEDSPEIAPGKIEGSAKITAYEANRVSLAVETLAPALLVLSDTYYPGWQATIDGRATKIYRANYTFRAVAVPAGQHEVNFTYQPDSLRWGIIGSLTSLLLLAGLSLVKRPNL